MKVTKKLMSDKYVNVELFSLTYGSLVRSVVKETNNITDANAKLMKIGTSIGNRITDDLVVHNDKYSWKTFSEVTTLISDYAFKNCLGILATKQDTSETSCIITINDNPITRYVTIPLEHDGLIYLSPLLGAIKTILGMLHYNCDVSFKADRLKGDNTTQIEIKLIEVSYDNLPPGEYLA